MPSKLFFSSSSFSPPSIAADINLNSPNKGLNVDRSDNLSDVQVEGAAAANSAHPLPPGLTEEEAEELHVELTKVSFSQ